MNKSELIARITDDTGLAKAKATEVVDLIGKVITEELKHGDGLSITGFGAFKLSERKAKTGRNPQTGEAITIAAKKVPVFKAGKALKDAVK